ncbi:MAG: helix-turn-helix domain-containing protein [Pseudomonadota bacterium]|nr:helix-turn-helix domain-containing protein [Pseudomonadota bacterium]
MNEILKISKQFKTQQEFADHIGISQSSVSQWLSTKKPKRPSIEHTKLLESLFNVPREKIRPDIFGN